MASEKPVRSPVIYSGKIFSIAESYNREIWWNVDGKLGWWIAEMKCPKCGEELVRCYYAHRPNFNEVWFCDNERCDIDEIAIYYITGLWLVS